ncbi:MAG TPA: NAD(P)/FAD-dependent oxidoreductase [Candidatus Cloacimonadota bacterium]|nr:NAD(P)/FAD-dependent oxidoreductase [Candidatus Cloacimonadota bacterium]
MQTSKTWDLLIVGGGPAGLCAAKAAAEKGLSVLVLEKNLEIGSPVHTSGGSWTRELKAFGIPESFLHPVHHLEFISKMSKAAFHYDFPEICMLDVHAFYQYLAEQASLAGAVIYTNTTVKNPLLENGKICGVQAMRNGLPAEYKARIIIDAGGLGGVIARKMGLRTELAGYGKGAEYEIFTSNWQQDKTAILLGSDFSPLGYAWIFPYGKNRVRLGFGVLAPQCKDDPLPLLDNFINSDHPLARQLQPYSIVETHFGSLPNCGYLEKTYAENLLVCGDAAGHVLSISGEGIRPAMEIGKIAGTVAAEAIAKNDTSEAFLKRYEARWKRKYARSIELNTKLNEIIRQYNDTQWDKVLNILKDVDPAIVLALMKGYFDLNLLRLILTKNPGLFAHNAMQIVKKAITG